jgi:hypothetical protein
MSFSATQLSDAGAALSTGVQGAYGSVQSGSNKAAQRGKKASTGLSTAATIASTAAVATSIFAASAAANAVPIAGQFVSAGLAIAGLLTKIFAGRRQAKKEKAFEARQDALGQASEAIKGGAPGAPARGVGMGAAQGPIGTTAPVAPPAKPSFNTWNGGVAPSMQPTQVAINSAIGLQ